MDFGCYRRLCGAEQNSLDEKEETIRSSFIGDGLGGYEAPRVAGERAHFDLEG